MGEEEDKLLTSVLINLSTFMNIASVSVDKRKQLITNLMMYCRLCQHCDKITSTLEVYNTITILPLKVKFSGKSVWERYWPVSTVCEEVGYLHSPPRKK